MWVRACVRGQGCARGGRAWTAGVAFVCVCVCVVYGAKSDTSACIV